MKESDLEKILVDETRKEGGWAYKWASPGNDGVPDRIVCFPDGEIYFVELKTETGRVSPQQKIQLNRLNGFGQKAVIVRGLAGLIRFFRETGREHVAKKLEERYGVRAARLPEALH